MLFLGQIATKRESDEITTILALSGMRTVVGSVITIDATGYQMKIVNQISF